MKDRITSPENSLASWEGSWRFLITVHEVNNKFVVNVWRKLEFNQPWAKVIEEAEYSEKPDRYILSDASFAVRSGFFKDGMLNTDVNIINAANFLASNFWEENFKAY